MQSTYNGVKLFGDQTRGYPYVFCDCVSWSIMGQIKQLGSNWTSWLGCGLRSAVYLHLAARGGKRRKEYFSSPIVQNIYGRNMLIIYGGDVVEHRGQVRISRLIMCSVLSAVVKIEHWNASYARMTGPKKRLHHNLFYFYFYLCFTFFLCGVLHQWACVYSHGRP